MKFGKFSKNLKRFLKFLQKLLKIFKIIKNVDFHPSRMRVRLQVSLEEEAREFSLCKKADFYGNIIKFIKFPWFHEIPWILHKTALFTPFSQMRLQPTVSWWFLMSETAKITILPKMNTFHLKIYKKVHADNSWNVPDPCPIAPRDEIAPCGETPHSDNSE